MQQTKHSLLAIIILTLVVAGCQQVNSDEILPTTEAIVAKTEMVTLPSPAPTATNTATPLPTLADIPTSTPINTPIPPPTPTAIPADAPTPTATNTPASLSTAASPSDETDLVTLEESLALLDRVERRKVEPTSTPIRPIVYEGTASYTSRTDICTCSTCNGLIFTTEVFIDAEGNVTGILKPREVEFAGTRNTITGKRTGGPNNCEAYWTLTLQTRLTDNDQTFEGTLERTYTPGNCYMDNCGGIWTFALSRK